MGSYKETRRVDLEKQRGRSGRVEPVVLRRGEKGAVVELLVEAGGEPFALDGFDATFCAVNARGEVVIRLATVSDPAAGIVIYEVSSDLTAVAGSASVAYVRLAKGDYVVTTDAIPVVVLEDADIETGAAAEYESVFDSLTAALRQALADAGATEARIADAEALREDAEAARVAAEQSRSQAEQGRSDAEAARAAAEQSRLDAESSRASAESSRAIAEAARAASFSVMEQRSKGWLRYYCSDGDYDEETRRPTVAEPDESTLYYVPALSPSDENRWVEWQYESAGDRWELQGSTVTSFSPLTTGQIDGLLEGDPPQGSEVLTGAGLTYLWRLMAATTVGELFGI